MTCGYELWGYGMGLFILATFAMHVATMRSMARRGKSLPVGMFIATTVQLLLAIAMLSATTHQTTKLN